MVLQQTEPSDGAPEAKGALAVQEGEAEAPFTMTAPVPYAGSGLRNPFPPIADYAFLSDCENTCLISSAGSVEWLCVPRPDSASVFGAILDRGAGHFRLGPYGVSVPAARRYLPGSLILETTWQTHTGARRAPKRRTGPPEVARAAVEDRAEDTRGVRTGDAQPFHRTGRRDQAGVLAVGQERIVSDRGKGVPQPAAGVRDRCRHGERGFRLAFLNGQRSLGLRGPVGRLGLLQDHADIIDRRAARRPLVPTRVRWRSVQRRANSATCSADLLMRRQR